MISKNFRLKENEVKKVLKFGKPFFSYGMVLNYKNNNFENNRFAIIISGKNTEGGVERNFFRRRFYDFCKEYLKGSNDLVFVLKKQIKLDKTKIESINGFDKDITFLLKSINKIKDEKYKR